MVVKDERQSISSGFRKKVYRQLDTSPLPGDYPASSISSVKESDRSLGKKRIVSSSGITGLREEFKKTFLPLLIDIFELRQMIENVKTNSASSLPLEKTSKSPQQILVRLTQLQSEIEESQRWCDGVILQISKGIAEAKEALKYVECDLFENMPTDDSPTEKQTNKKSFWKRFFLRRKNR